MPVRRGKFDSEKRSNPRHGRLTQTRGTVIGSAPSPLATHFAVDSRAIHKRNPPAEDKKSVEFQVCFAHLEPT